MLMLRRWMVIVLAMQASLRAADNPRHIDLGPGVTALKTLEQNWTDTESNKFYNMAQGSRLVPYDWFLHLEQAESQDRFRDAKHIRALGYIPRTPDLLNADGLPVGFIKDVSYEDGTLGLGLTCAACHTSQILHNGTAYLIDGGPTMGDFERLMKELAAALQATSENDAKFERFAAAVLPAGSSADDKATLRASTRSVAELRTKYNERNLPKLAQNHFGPGRVDAFGAIFNEVSVTFLNLPQNAQPANAPVSYPCLWDAPQHDKVQWNGAAKNQVNPLGEVLFGTDQVGALGRNSGEVLGVFGNAEINAHELSIIPRRYPSTINKANLIAIENLLKSLWSPKWPEEALGAINTDSMTKGELLFKERCADCHKAIDRKDPNREVVAQLSNVGTDQNMIRNFGRSAKTGILKERRKTLLGLERMGEKEPIGVILKHVVERVILKPQFNPLAIREALAEADNPLKVLKLIDSLNPGYRMTATIEVGEKQLVGQFDSLIAQGQSLKVGGGRFHLMEKGRNIATQGLGEDLVDLRSLDSVLAAARRLEGIITAEVSNSGQSIATLNNATVKIGYKARPLNGVWATAPYLHNGSVPNLVELLKPAAQRVKTFHVGSQEFDRVNVGFKDDPNQPLFDTNVDGNANTGHEYGTDLSTEQRSHLIEYLKSL